MIYTQCPRCRKRIAVGTQCSCYERTRRAKGKGNRLDQDSFYRSQEWRAVRSEAIAKTYGLDIYSLYIENKIEYGFTVHHIVPLEEDYRKRAEQSNLIYLSESHHRQIHEMYKTDFVNTSIMLADLLDRFAKDFGNTSGFKPIGGISKTFSDKPGYRRLSFVSQNSK